MSTLKFFSIRVAEVAKKFWNGEPVWHIGFAGPIGNAPGGESPEALDLR